MKLEAVGVTQPQNHGPYQSRLKFGKQAYYVMEMRIGEEAAEVAKKLRELAAQVEASAPSRWAPSRARHTRLVPRGRNAERPGQVMRRAGRALSARYIGLEINRRFFSRLGMPQPPAPEHQAEEAQADNHDRVGFGLGYNGAEAVDGDALVERTH
jgi:hypothetical protein